MKKPKLLIIVLFQNLGEENPWYAQSPAPPLPGILLAGMTPDIVDVDVLHEMVRPIDYRTDADYVAISFMDYLAPHAYEVAARFKALGKVVVGGDGQVSMGQTILKQTARKIRRLYNDKILAGFAGSAADSFALFARFEAKLEQYRGNLERSAVELAKDWRTDRYLRRLEAMMIVADAQVSLVLTGTGDVLEPENGVMGIGSGGNYALAAARALIDGALDAEAIVRKSLDIAAEICVYTNRNVTIEKLTT